MLYVNGTHTQRNQWNDEFGSDTEGALVEYTTGAGETARRYTTTTDSQGNYIFAGLAPGVYTVQSTTHGTTSSQRVVIWADQRDVRVDFVNRNVTTSLRQTMTAQPTATRTATQTATPTPGMPNVASSATVSVSSIYNSDYDARKAVDGIVMMQAQGEWASSGQTNPWIQLNWNKIFVVNRIVLFDRANTSDSVNGGLFTFSDGSSLSVSNIPNSGIAFTVTFASKNINWVLFQVVGGTGPNVGLSEIEVYGTEISKDP